MKKAGLFIAVIVALALMAPVAASAGEKVNWVPADQAAKLAKKTGKKQYIFFYTDWCGYCKKMTGLTLADDAVARFLNENFVAVMINPEKDKDARTDIKARGYPTNAFVDSSDKLITAIPGYSPPEYFLSLLKFIHTGANESMSFKDFLAQQQEKDKAGQ
ncbi:MAG: thioredoxin fold domain-containing protein [Proteobacteria bacterium]|nr:thioredoxin fold domain-containing protein [Pseudomonadota bacterium]